MAEKQTLGFLNSNLGILILSSLVIAPIGYVFKEYRESQRQEAEEQKRREELAVAEKGRMADEAERRRQQVDKLCTEIFQRMNQFRDINATKVLSAADQFQLFTALPNAFPPPLAITASSPDLEKVSTGAVVGQLETATSSDDTLRTLAATIRREHENALAAYRAGNRLEGRDALRRQAQALISCREVVQK